VASKAVQKSGKKPILLPGQIIAGIAGRIYSLRGQRVMLSHDLAALYQVETRTLMQAVQRMPITSLNILRLSLPIKSLCS
jgi:hypothetical protein